MRFFRLLLILCLLAPVARTENVFAPYLNDTSPEIVEVLETRTIGEIEFTRLKFLQRIDHVTGEPNLIYAVMARPTTPGPHPGVLVCHGGGGYADQVAPQVQGWARRGFVSVGQDQPGICTVSKALSSGPMMTRSRWNGERPEDTSLYDGVAAALNGLRLLRSQPDVDRARIGVTGGSWGGYMTTMISGLAGDRVDAACSIYGCGFYDEAGPFQPELNSLTPERRAMWLENLDAGRRSHNITADYLLLSPVNDWYFWPDAVMKTLGLVQGETNVCFMANDSHVLTEPGGTHGPPDFDRTANRTWMEQVWMNQKLKGEGEPFPKARSQRVIGREGDGIRVEFVIDGPTPFYRAAVWYSAGELPWRLRWWQPVPVEALDHGHYQAVLPVTEPDQPIDWYGVVSDTRQLSVSTLIETLRPADLGFTSAGLPAVPLSQGFEDPNQARRWRRAYLERRDGRSSRTASAAAEGASGLELKGEATFGGWGVRAAQLARSGATSLRVMLRAAEGTTPFPRFDLVAEAPDSRRYVWQWPLREAPLTETWQEVVLPFSALEYVGQDDPPVELFSAALGMLRVTTTAGAWLYLDEVRFE